MTTDERTELTNKLDLTEREASFMTLPTLRLMWAAEQRRLAELDPRGEADR